MYWLVLQFFGESSLIFFSFLTTPKCKLIWHFLKQKTLFFLANNFLQIILFNKQDIFILWQFLFFDYIHFFSVFASLFLKPGLFFSSSFCNPCIHHWFCCRCSSSKRFRWSNWRGSWNSRRWRWRQWCHYFIIFFWFLVKRMSNYFVITFRLFSSF